jgi:hypothetical protein
MFSMKFSFTQMLCNNAHPEGSRFDAKNFLVDIRCSHNIVNLKFLLVLEVPTKNFQLDILTRSDSKFFCDSRGGLLVARATFAYLVALEFLA